MPDNERNREWLDLPDREPRSPGLPRPDLNPLVNPLLGRNMGRWAQVYFTNPPEQREQAVENLVQELQAEAAGTRTPASSTASSPPRPAAAPKPTREIEQPAMPQFTKFKPQLVQTAEQDFVLCPGCLHKNAAEQRFCGICGLPLARVPETAAARPDPLPTSGSMLAENPESDWQWLRQRTLIQYDPPLQSKSGPRFLLTALIFLAVIAGAYFVWQNRSRLLHKQVSASSSSAPSAQEQPSYALDIPAATPAAPHPVAGTKSPTITTATAPLGPPESTSAAPIGTSQQTALVPASAGGSDELDQGRRYLEGTGVPRSSWMASQWLWKAVAKQNTEAALLLSDLYVRGDGVPRSCEQARVLLVASAKKGSAAAAQKLRSVESGCQ